MLEPVDEAPPQGMVIIGLGPSGELVGGRSSAVAVTRALLRVALNELDRRLAADAAAAESAVAPLGVSSVLIGSSAGGGLPVEASVRALIDGVDRRQRRLARLKVLSGAARSARPMSCASTCSRSSSATRTGSTSSSACSPACSSSRVAHRQRPTPAACHVRARGRAR